MKTLEQIKAIIDEMIEKGIKKDCLIHDYDNTEFVISDIQYDQDQDKIFVKFE